MFTGLIRGEPAPPPSTEKVVVTAINQPTSFVITATSCPTDPFTPTPELSISDIYFCSTPCDQASASSQTQFPSGVRDIYFSFRYSGIKQGMAYTRVWTNRSQIWVRYTCKWKGPENGTFSKFLYDHDGGLRSGTWTMTIEIAGHVTATGSVNVMGNNDFWDPFSGTQSCPDW